MVATLFVLAAANPLRAQTAPAGSSSASATPGFGRRSRAAAAQAFLPQRGVFNFPAPYGTQGIRITNASDCGGSDCVDYGYSYWNKINNHAGSDTMLIVVGLNRSRGGSGPTLFTLNKNTGETRNAGPLFDAEQRVQLCDRRTVVLQRHPSSPTLYLGENGPRMLRYDVLSRTFETVFDVTSLLGGGKYLWQMHSSSDDRVHSATVKDSNTYQDLGCIVYREDTRQHLFFTPRGDYDECQIDKSGRWLVIKENVDNQYNEDNRIIDIETGAEQVLWDQDGAAGHSDMGYGYIVGEDDKWAANPYGVRVWQFGPNMTSAGGRLVYAMPSWNGPGLGHIAHSNSKAGLPLDQQMACSSNAGDSSLSRTNEIVCFRLDGSMQVLVVAPNMTDLNASGGGGDAYSKRPKGNIDPTGEYFLWTSNMGGNRADVFIVRIPAQLLGVHLRPHRHLRADASPRAGAAQLPHRHQLPHRRRLRATGPAVTDPVQWMFTVNVTATGEQPGEDRRLRRLSGCQRRVVGRRSAAMASCSSWRRKPARSGTSALAMAVPGTAPGDINFALRLQNGVAEVRESNAYRTEIGFAAGDTLAIVGREQRRSSTSKNGSRLLHERHAGDVSPSGCTQCSST